MSKTILGNEDEGDRIVKLAQRLDREGELTTEQAERSLGRVGRTRGVVWGPVKYGTTQMGRYAKITIVSEDDDDVVVFAYAHNLNCERNPDGDSLGLGGVDDGAIADVVWSWNSVSEEKRHYRILEAVVSVEPVESE